MSMSMSGARMKHKRSWQRPQQSFEENPAAAGLGDHDCRLRAPRHRVKEKRLKRLKRSEAPSLNSIDSSDFTMAASDQHQQRQAATEPPILPMSATTKLLCATGAKLIILTILQNRLAGVHNHQRAMRLLFVHRIQIHQDECFPVIQILTSLMIQYITDEQFQLDGFQCIRHVLQELRQPQAELKHRSSSTSVSSSPSSLIASIARNQICHSVLNTLIWNAQSDRVQMAGFEILEWLIVSSLRCGSDSGDTDTDDENIEENISSHTHRNAKIANHVDFLDRSTLKILLQMLRMHSGNVGMQRTGTSILSFVVEHDGYHQTVVESGGISCMLMLLNMYPNDTLIQCNGIATLCWLIHRGGDAAKRQFIQTNGGMQTLLNTTHMYMSKPSILGNCLCLLSAFPNEVPSKSTIQMVLRCMKQHPESIKVQRNCLNLIRQLTTAVSVTDNIETNDNNNNDNSNGDGHRQHLQQQGQHLAWFAQSDGITCIHNAMTQHQDDDSIQAQACGLLAILCCVCDALREPISASGCLEAVVSCQLRSNRRKNSSRVQHAAIWFQTCMLLDCVDRNDVRAFGGGAAVIHNLMEAS